MQTKNQICNPKSFILKIQFKKIFLLCLAQLNNFKTEMRFLVDKHKKLNENIKINWKNIDVNGMR